MEVKLIVENPGLLTTVQDLGRYGYQQYGMPVAGAIDIYALKTANILAGNDINDAGLEITFAGFAVRFEGSGLAAVAGADLGACLNGRELAAWQSFEFKKGDCLAFTAVRKGCRAYMAVRGGIKVPLVMGSRSTYLRGGVGGYHGRKLKKGDVLTAGENVLDNSIKCGILSEEFIPDYNRRTIRAIPGPQDECFSREELEKFFSSSYMVTNQSDRMGYRLEGPVIKHEKGPDIVSDGIAPGAIQIPGHGQPIVMLADRQTTGGYTKIANVISVDLLLFAQLKTGDKINFQMVGIEEAQELLQEEEIRLKKIAQILAEQTGWYKDYLFRMNDKEYKVRVQEIN